MVPNYRGTVTIEYEFFAVSPDDAQHYIFEDAQAAAYMLGGDIVVYDVERIEPLATNQESTAPAATSAH